jgi:hypothetical protein
MERNYLKRAEYVLQIATSYTPEQLVMVDESSFDRRTTYRNYAYALKGKRAVRKCFYIRGKRCTSIRSSTQFLITRSQILGSPRAIFRRHALLPHC